MEKQPTISSTLYSYSQGKMIIVYQRVRQEERANRILLLQQFFRGKIYPDLVLSLLHLLLLDYPLGNEKKGARWFSINALVTIKHVWYDCD